MYRNITAPLTNCYHFSSIPNKFWKVLISRNLKKVVSSVIEINKLLMLAMLSAEAIFFYRIWADSLVLFQTLPFSQPFIFMPSLFVFAESLPREHVDGGPWWQRWPRTVLHGLLGFIVQTALRCPRLRVLLLSQYHGQILQRQWVEETWCYDMGMISA